MTNLNISIRKSLRRTDRFNQYAIAAATQAMADCGTDFKDLDPFRVGCIVGSGIGGFQSIEREYKHFLEKGGNRISVFFIPMMISNMAAGAISMRYGFKGINYAPVTAWRYIFARCRRGISQHQKRLYRRLRSRRSRGGSNRVFNQRLQQYEGFVTYRGPRPRFNPV